VLIAESKIAAGNSFQCKRFFIHYKNLVLKEARQ
jgi:hypothetical protein